MRLSKHAAWSSFDSSDELLPLLAVQPHQLSAAREPGEPIRDLIRKGEISKREAGPLVNRWFCGPGVH